MIYDILSYISLFYMMIQIDLDTIGYLLEILFVFKFKSLAHILNRIEIFLFIKGVNMYLIDLLKMLF